MSGADRAVSGVRRMMRGVSKAMSRVRSTGFHVGSLPSREDGLSEFPMGNARQGCSDAAKAAASIMLPISRFATTGCMGCAVAPERAPVRNASNWRSR
jgi:hypothetical protein